MKSNFTCVAGGTQKVYWLKALLADLIKEAICMREKKKHRFNNKTFDKLGI